MDSLNAVSTPAMVPIEIAHVNRPPVAVVINSLPIQGTMNQPVTITLVGQDVDVDLAISVSLLQILFTDFLLIVLELNSLLTSLLFMSSWCLGWKISFDMFKIFVSQLPLLGQLTQSDGTIISSASTTSPTAVTGSSGQVIYPFTLFLPRFYSSECSHKHRTRRPPTCQF